MNGVLDHARTIAEREEMPDPHLRYAVSVALGDDRINWDQYSSPGVFARRFWCPVHGPVFGADGRIVLIAQCVEEISDKVHRFVSGLEAGEPE